MILKGCNLCGYEWCLRCFFIDVLCKCSILLRRGHCVVMGLLFWGLHYVMLGVLN